MHVSVGFKIGLLMRTRILVASVLLICGFYLLGCSRSAIPTQTTPAAADVTWEETACPPSFAQRDFRLPAGCLVSDYRAGIAIYQQTLWQPYPQQRFGMIDLTTGEYSVVVASPVNSRLEYSMFSPKIGEGWIAWEEVGPNESREPQNADWVLYAAPLDAATRAVGTPMMVDAGNTSVVPRPFYGFDGGTLIWSRGKGPRQGGGRGASALVSRQLPSESVHTLYESDNGWRAVCVCGESVTITEARENRESAERVLVLDSRSGALQRSVQLPAEQSTSHFARVAAEGRIIYSAFTRKDTGWPNLYVIDQDGESRLICRNAMDAVPLGEWMLFERVPTTVSQLCGVSLATGSIITLNKAPLGYWQTPMAVSVGQETTMTVVTLDLAAYDESSDYEVVRVIESVPTMIQQEVR